MLMSVIEPELAMSVYGELAGARVLITGVSAAGGVDVARSFADHKARIVLHTRELSPEMVELGAHLTETALDVRMFDDVVDDQETAIRFAQKTATAFGGFDVVVNFIAAEDAADIGDDYDAIENYVSQTLLPGTLVTRVAANRMRLLQSDGMILNIVSMSTGGNGRQSALAGIVRAALAETTRRMAEEWADAGIRINAIGPRGTGASGHCLASEPEIAALALYLASRKGKVLSGQVFDADLAPLHC